MTQQAGQRTALTLLDEDGIVLRQVFVLGGTAFSLERTAGVLVGTHTEVSDRQKHLLLSRLDQLADEWAMGMVVS